MENEPNLKFKTLTDKIKLSNKEKEFHRGEILKLMEKEPLDIPKKIRSPFYFSVLLRRHFVVTTMVILFFVGGELVLSSGDSLPNDFLYQIKTKITEPVLVFFAPNKAQIKVALIEKRLQEFSEVTLRENLNVKEKVAFVKQFSLQVQNTHEEILQLNKNKNPSDALEATNDLQSVLSAQHTILERISDTSKEADDTDGFSSVLSEDIKATTVIEDKITQTLEDRDKEKELDQTILDQQEEIATSLANLGKIKENVGNKDSLLVVDQDYFDTKLSEVSVDIENADQKVREGNKPEALKLYSKIDQDLGELESLLKSSEKLNISSGEED